MIPWDVMVRGRRVQRCLLRHDGDGVHLDQEFRVGQSCHKHHGDGGRVWPATPDLLEDGEGGPDGLPLDQIDVPLDDVFQAGAGGLQGDLQVVEDLLGLGDQVAFADDRAGGVERGLARRCRRS